MLPILIYRILLTSVSYYMRERHTLTDIGTHIYIYFMIICFAIGPFFYVRRNFDSYVLRQFVFSHLMRIEFHCSSPKRNLSKLKTAERKKKVFIEFANQVLRLQYTEIQVNKLRKWE